MHKTYRYLILGAIFLLFLIIAPLLVFYVRGVTYDRDRGRLGQTGILAVRTDPADATLLLDGEVIRETPASVRFLEPREYAVSIQKDGYHTWSKTLSVLSQKVTWANPNPNKLTLFRNDQKPSKLAEQVTNFVLAGDHVAYLTDSSLVILEGAEYENLTTLPLPKSATAIASSADKTLLLITGPNARFAYELKTKQLTDATTLAPVGVPTTFFKDGTLGYLQNGTLVSVSLQTKRKTTLAKNVSAFAEFGETNYLIKRESSETTTRIVSGSSFSDADASTQNLAENLPVFQHTELIVTNGKELFLIGDGTLYRVGATLEPLFSNLTEWHYDRIANALVYTSNSELAYYDFGDHRSKLISRGSDTFTNPRLLPLLNFAFAFHQNQLKAIELDDRDRQNTYSFASLTNPQAFSISADSKAIFYLDNGILSLLTIR